MGSSGRSSRRAGALPRPPLGGPVVVRFVIVPVFFLLGRHDFNTPSALAADYMARLEGPAKGIIWFEESAHFPFWEEPGKFREALLWIDRTVREQVDF